MIAGLSMISCILVDVASYDKLHHCGVPLVSVPQFLFPTADTPPHLLKSLVRRTLEIVWDVMQEAAAGKGNWYHLFMHAAFGASPI